MRPKVSYDVDPHNRLIIKKPAGKSKVKQYRKIVNGRFKTDRKNKLYYQVYKGSDSDVPQKIGFSGDYSLDKKHNLIFTLNRWNGQDKGSRLRLRTKILHADGHDLVFLVRSKRSGNSKTFYAMRLQGAWQADKNNRLKFSVERTRRKKDALLLSGGWSLNKNNEIIYNHGLGSQDIILKGNWEIRDRYKLGYVLDKKIKSGFNFKASLGKVISKGKKPRIEFGVTIGASKKKRLKRKIIFTCKAISKKRKIIMLEVLPRERGARLKLSKKILDRNGLLYLEGLLKDRERYMGGGMAMQW